MEEKKTRKEVETAILNEFGLAIDSEGMRRALKVYENLHGAFLSKGLMALPALKVTWPRPTMAGCGVGGAGHLLSEKQAREVKRRAELLPALRATILTMSNQFATAAEIANLLLVIDGDG